MLLYWIYEKQNIQIKAARIDVRLHHLRTADGRECDLLLENEHGYVAIEIKQTSRIDVTDARHFRGLVEILDKPLLLSLVLSNDQKPRQLGEGTWAVPVVWALAPDSV